MSPSVAMTCEQMRPARRVHLGGGSPGERHQEDTAWVDAVDDQVSDPMREGIGLT